MGDKLGQDTVGFSLNYKPMLKLYLPTLRILVLLLKSVVNSHATMIMTIGNNHQGSS